ncbi:MAG TPA: hypothetical protein VE911_10635 [Candidatus Nitrosopolaris sp.]|nr:hypothetical protein [Candidatus Nitrosopolaris sp.]
MRLLLPLVALATPLAAAAHPLGNFTINHYAAVHVGQRVLTVRYVVDMAEIPAYQTIGEIDRNGNGTIDPDEREAYLSRAPADLARHLTLIVDGREVPLTAGQGTLSLPPGAGGLPTLRLEVTFEASLPGARGEVEFRDGNFPGRLGWQEVIADSGDGIALLDSTVPRTDRSRALRDYPTDLLARPPHVTEARFRMASATAGDGGTGAATVHDTSTAPGGFRDRLTELIATRAPLGPGLVVTSLLVAAALGALHALSPGHGKTIVGAYLIGARWDGAPRVFPGYDRDRDAHHRCVRARSRHAHRLALHRAGAALPLARRSVGPPGARHRRLPRHHAPGGRTEWAPPWPRARP